MRRGGVETQQRMMEYIVEYHNIHGYMPTYREIGNGIGLSSLQSVNYHMTRLFDTGCLETDIEPLMPRAYRIGENYAKNC